METLQVQTAGAASPTLPASISLSGTPTAGDSFASTFGHALDDMSDSAAGESSITPKAPPREKSAVGKSSDSSSTAGMFLNCFITNLAPPVPAAALNTEGAASSASLSSVESTVDSPPDLNTSGLETSANFGTFPMAVAPRSSGSGGQGHNPICGPAVTSKQSQLPSTANSMLLSLPSGLAGPLADAIAGQPVDQQLGGALSELRCSSARPSQESGFRQKSQASPGFADSSQIGNLDPAQVQAVLPRPSGQDLQAISDSTLTAAQTDPAASASDPEATDNSVPVSPIDTSELAELPNMAGNLASQDFQPASSATPPSGRVGQAPPQGAETSQSFTSGPTSGDLERAEFSGLLGNFASAEVSVKLSENGSPRASALASPASKPENSVNEPANLILHPAPTSESVENSQTSLSSSASPDPSRQLDANLQANSPATISRRDPGTTGIQAIAGAAASLSDGKAHASLADASAGGHGKSGQQSVTASGDNTAGFTTFASNTANNPSADPTTSLLTAHPPSVPATHANTTTPQTLPSSNEPPTTLSAWQNYDGGPGKIVRSASLTDSAGGSEMHVELRTGALGPLELHAVVHEGSVGAEIHVQGQEAHTLLAAGLPSLERALGERNLRVENISVYHDQSGGGASGGGKQDSHSGSPPSPQHQALPWDRPPQVSESAIGSLEDNELANPVAGLSVQA